MYQRLVPLLLTVVLSAAMLAAGACKRTGDNADEPAPAAATANPVGSPPSSATANGSDGDAAPSDGIEAAGDPFLGVQLPRTGATRPLEEAPRVFVLASLEAITVDGRTAAALASGRAATDTAPEVLWAQVSGAIREAVDARWMALLETTEAHLPVADEHGISVTLAADAALPIATFNDLLAAVEATGQPAEVVGLDRHGTLRRVDFAAPNDAVTWEPSIRPDSEFPIVRERHPLDPNSRSGRPQRVYEVELTPDQIAGRTPLPSIEQSIVAPSQRGAEAAPAPGPNWEDRSLPIRISVHPGGVWLTAGTLDRRLSGYTPTGLPRDASHPNLAATRVWSAGGDLSSWLAWAELQRQLEGLRARSLAYELAPSVQVGVSDELPVGVLIRTLDVVNCYAPTAALVAGGAEFEESLMGGEGEPEFLPRPTLFTITGMVSDDGVSGRTAIIIEDDGGAQTGP